MREIILAVDPKIKEDIKWSSPTFIYKGNMASYFMNAKKHVSLMFHKGAAIPGKHPILEGDAKEGRTAKFADMKDIEAKKKDLVAAVKAWVKMQDKG